MHTKIRLCLSAAACLMFASAEASSNPITVGNARFTVVTRECVRMEYADNGTFVDAPSMFAANRTDSFKAFRVRRNGSATTIDTGEIVLTYTPDGKPFSPSNLQAQIKTRSKPVLWTPGAANPGNLGGTIRTLDGVNGPRDLGQGLLSRDGWFVLDDSHSPLLTADWVQSRPKTAGTDMYLFGYGDDFKGALKSLTMIGGPVPLPRRYTLGVWYSRYWPYSSTDFRNIVQEYGAHGFPLDTIVMDMDWHVTQVPGLTNSEWDQVWTGYTWNRKLLPDAEDLVKWFHQQGLAVTLNDHPADGMWPHEERYAEFMKLLGKDPASKERVPFDAGSQAYMKAFLATAHAPHEAEGVDFWWLDWQQFPFTLSVPDLSNLAWLNNLYFKNTAVDGKRGQSFSRWAGWGDHRHPIHFSGDADTGWPMLAFEVPFTSTAGNVGCFFWSHDIGGHMGGRNEESYTRWCQFGATTAALRSHSTRNSEMDRRPWTYPKWAEDSMRISFGLRSELFPYIYTSAWESCRDTVPLDRPLYVEYPDSEWAFHNGQEFLLGENLLVAPIASPGVGPGKVSQQIVKFPEGANWFNYFSGEQYSGGEERLVSADINEFPLYVKGGVPVPMQPYQPRPATAPLTTLRLRCYPGEEGKLGSSVLYEDDGVTTLHEKGEFATTALTYSRSGNRATVQIGAAKGTFKGMPSQRVIVLELPNTEKATTATVDRKPVSLQYDAKAHTNVITLSARSTNRPVRIVVEVAILDPKVPAAVALAHRAEGILGADETGKSLSAILESPTTDPRQREALLALAGVGLVSRHESPVFAVGDTRWYLFAPSELVDSQSLKIEGLAGQPPRGLHQGFPVSETGPNAKAPQVHVRIFEHEWSLPVGPS